MPPIGARPQRSGPGGDAPGSASLRAGIVGAVILGTMALLAVVGVRLQDAPASPSLSGGPVAKPSSVVPSEPAAGGVMDLASIQAGPHVVFQNVIRDSDYAHVSVVPLDEPGGPRVASDLICERVHVAGGQGLCLAGEHEAESRYYALPFGEDFVPRERIPLAGPPIFVRLSPDGRYGAASVLTEAPSEEDPEAPTQTLLIDLAKGTVLGDIAAFALSRDGVPFDAPDRDLWGVSFGADGDRFYATLRTAGNLYLVEGSIQGRRLEVLHPNVSAPTVSPDGTRLAYAKLLSNIGPTFRFHVLDLSTMTETPLAEATSVDDQMEWLDDERLLYGLGTDTWVVSSDGGGEPSIFLLDGLSPSVVP